MAYSVLDIAKRSRFEVTETGGGIQSLLRRYRDAHYCIVTRDGELPTDEHMEEEHQVGFYDQNDEQVLAFLAPNFLAAMAMVEAVRPGEAR